MSLMKILNVCKTAIGRRYFRNRLLSPTTNINDLNISYKQTECFKQCNLWKSIGRQLEDVVDIERLYRRLEMNTIQPCEFVTFFHSFMKIHQVISYIIENLKEIINDNNIFDNIMRISNTIHLDKFQEFCESKLNFDEMYKYNIDNLKVNIFKYGVYSDIDEVYEKITNCLNIFDRPGKALNELSKGEMDGWLKLEHNDKDGYFYMITGKRFEILKSTYIDNLKFKKILKTDQELIQLLLVNGFKSATRNTSQSVKIQSPHMKKMVTDLTKYYDTLRNLISMEFRNFTDEIQEQFGETVKNTIRTLESIDFHFACAKNSVLLGHNIPTIVSIENDSNFIDVEDLRHPIIENVQMDIQYVPNSTCIGSKDKIPNGMVLYGVNAAGKSSFMKSIGVAIIMAQAGMHVAAKSMHYKPYEYLFTRIQSRDDIYKGMSTFSVELSELRNILKRVNSKSLVIGDELCSGTETVSGVSIVCAGIKTLVDKNSTFVFATHLHQLTHLNIVKELDNNGKICVNHLSVEYDESSDTLIYDRKLKKGPGKELYGLEVCKAMDLEPEFMHLAGTIRQELLHGTHIMTTNNKSRYNNDVIMDKCGVCGKSNVKLESHHIRYQMESDNNGMIDKHFHKNIKSNLVPLCERCHDEVHNNTLYIKGWIQTTRGIRLDYKHINVNNIEELFGEDAENFIRDHKFEINEIKYNTTVKNTIHILKTKYGIKLSDYKIKKCLKML